MTDGTSCPDGRYCARADTMLGVEDVHVTSVTATPTALFLRVETGDTIAGCPECGVTAAGHGGREVR